MIFEWDEEKAKKNYHDHGISFETAKLVFNDPEHIELYDDEHSIDEDRYIAIGIVENVLFVVFTVREYNNKKEEVIRLISARVLTPQERRDYYDG